MTGLTRRDVLRRGGALALAAGGWSLIGPFGAGAAPASAATLPPFSLPLRVPRTITDPDVTLRVAPADVQVFPGGPATRMWTFGGEFPGPIIRRPGGSTTRLTFEHALPASAGTLTIHHHGHHSRSSEDGQPDEFLIAPGAGRTYTYEHVEDGAPLRAAMRWYHDHSHGQTNRNAWMGLVGLFITNDDHEGSLRLPSGDAELALVLCEREFDGDNQLTQPFAPAAPPGDDAVGTAVNGTQRTLVNGVPEPYADVEARRYRLRILNASAFHPYDLSFDDGMAFQIVGTESGLLPEPVAATSVLIGPAERVDVVVDFAQAPGEHVVLRSRPQPSTAPATAAADAQIMQFRVGAARVADPSRVPAVLRPLPAWAKALQAAGPRQLPDRVFAFGLGVDPAGTTAWTINGRPYDPARVDARPELGATETWLLVNTSATSHYAHLHDQDWIVLGRDGAAPAAREAGLKETFRLDPGETVLVGTRFTDHLGRFMVHCHMLNHEDHAMMTAFEVVEPGQGSPTAVVAAEAARVEQIVAHQRSRAGRPAPAPARPLEIDLLGSATVDACDLRRALR